MPRQISKELKEKLSSPVLTIAYCICLKFRDGYKKCYTTHDQIISFENEKFFPNSSFKPSAIYYKEGMSVDNLELSSLLDFDLEKLLSGYFDGAYVEIFLLNYLSPQHGKMILFHGEIGEINLNDNKYVAQLRGRSSCFSNNIGSIYSPNCRARFCDSDCGLNLADYQFNGRIEKIIDQNNFITNLAQPNGYFTRGWLQFSKGKNEVGKLDIKNYFNNEVELFTTPCFPIHIGDEFVITAGCDKEIKTCVSKFNNAINFRGEPHLPKFNN